MLKILEKIGTKGPIPKRARSRNQCLNYKTDAKIEFKKSIHDRLQFSMIY